MQAINEQTQAAHSLTIPAPVGGWNARDPLDAMAPTDAVDLVNWFPENNRVVLKNGFRTHSKALGTTAVDTLVEYASSSGTRQLISACTGNIYNSSAFDANGTSLGSGFTSNRWQTTLFRNTLIFCNGVDQPQQWNGTTLSNATYTGIANDNLLNDVTHYRGRLYFIDDADSVWYGAVDAITGALTEFPLRSLFRFGGAANAVTTWTTDAGNAINEYFVVVSKQGEVLIYSGDNPSASTWWLIARAKFPPPLGRRCFLQYGKDVYVLTQQGLISLSQALFGERGASTWETLTDKIRNAINEKARSIGGNFGWQVVNYPRGHFLLINVPLVEAQQSEQYVMNTQTGAWCKFVGMVGSTWAVFNDKLYFGGARDDLTAGGAAVFEADVNKDHNGETITTKLQHAFNYFDSRSHIKQFNMVRPVIQSTGAEFDIGVDMLTDFEERGITNTITISGSDGTPWGSPWGSPWANSERVYSYWKAVTGIGRAGSLVYQGAYKGISVQLTASDVNFIPGGVL